MNAVVPRFRLYIAASLDGYIADADGSVAWLDAFQDQDYGYKEFVKELGAVVTGRATYDQALGFGDWPYGGKTVYVLTSRPLSEAPDGVVRWEGGVLDLVAHIRSTPIDGDVWILGGAQVVEAMLAENAVDTLELFVIPILLGDGIPLFTPNERRTRWNLVSTRAYPNGVMGLVYEPSTAR